MNQLFLQIFLLINVFLIGALSTVVVQHALAHFRPRKEDRTKPTVRPLHLAPEVRQQLLDQAAERFHKELETASKELGQNVKATAAELNGGLQKIGGEIIQDEMKRYHNSLEELRAQTEIAIGGAQTTIKDHQTELTAAIEAKRAELETSMNAEVELEKQKLIAQIDTRLGDAVASFLIETLGHDVDLGAQTAYITAQLDAHKDEFKRGVQGEVSSTA